jgi:hypothetical protein
MEESPKTGGWTKRQFLRRVVVGGGTVMFVATDYLKPELETLLGPQVAHAYGSQRPSGNPRGRYGRGWGPGGNPGGNPK